MFRGLDPQRATDLRDRRARYERRARSIRYGSVRAGSLRHLLQATYRAVTDLRRPTRLLGVLVGVGSICTAFAGFAVRPVWLLVVAAVALPTVIGLHGTCTWLQERRHARRQPGVPGVPPLVSPPERPARRAPQES